MQKHGKSRPKQPEMLKNMFYKKHISFTTTIKVPNYEEHECPPVKSPYDIPPL